MEIFEHKKYKALDFAGYENYCVICMNEYEEGEPIIILPCNKESNYINIVIKLSFSRHFFHENCIKKWLMLNGLCPICKIEIR